jgi:CheY-like chemotaxis protein
VSKEKRKAARGDVSATVVLLEGDQPLGNFRVLNLSAGGALLVGRAPRQRPAEFDVLVRLSTGRTVRAAGVIVREESVDESSVFAIEFVRLARADREEIDSLLLTAIEDERDPTALVVVAESELRQLLRRQLKGLGHPSFGVSSAEDAITFLASPNVVKVALIDLSLDAELADKVLNHLAKKHPKIRRIVMNAQGTPPAKPATKAHPLAQQVIDTPWTRESLARAFKN